MGKYSFTLSQVTDALQSEVMKAGLNFVYPKERRPEEMCHYVWNGEADCLVGRALSSLGVSTEDLIVGNPSVSGGLSNGGHTAYVLLERLWDGPTEGTEFNEIASRLMKAQAAQDEGERFGTALTAFERNRSHWMI